LSQLREQIENVSAAKSEVVVKRPWRGPNITINKQRGGAAERSAKQATA
jgi:hypothetical protein